MAAAIGCSLGLDLDRCSQPFARRRAYIEVYTDKSFWTYDGSSVSLWSVGRIQMRPWRKSHLPTAEMNRLEFTPDGARVKYV